MSTIEARQRPAEPPRAELPQSSRPPRGRVVRAWPIALRLARREVRRRPGRTILVMLLVVLPVFVMTVGSVMVRSDTSQGFFGAPFETSNSITVWPETEDGVVNLSAREGVAVGAVDALPVGEESQVSEPFTDEQIDALRSVVGDRAEVIPITSVFSAVATSSTTELMHLIEWPEDASERAVDTTLTFDAGREPAAPNEVLLSRSVAESFDVGIGDELVLTTPARRWQVVGVARTRASFSQDFAYVGALDRSDIVPQSLEERLSVIPIGELSDTELRAIASDVQLSLGTTSVSINGGDFYGPDDQTKTLAWGWVGGVVSLIAVGVVISAAFATSARRQMATVGQLSANGAPAKVIERSLALQGSWTGALGSVLGIGLGLLAVFVAWGAFEDLVGYELPDRQIAPFDLMVIAVTATLAGTIAALFPAKSAARVPVLTALAGRRPVGAIPSWLVPLGVLATIGGLGLLTLVALDGGGGDLAAFVAVVGAVSVMVGLISTSPLLIEVAGRIGHAWPGSLLLAVRSLVRQRTRSAAVVSAIAVIMALTMAGLTGLGVAESESGANTISNRTIKARSITAFAEVEVADVALPETVADQITALVPDAQRVDVQVVPIDIPQFSSEDYQVTATVATNDVIALLGLSESNLGVLREAGIAAGRNVFGPDGAVSDDVAVLEDVSFNNSVVWFDFVATPEWVAERELEMSTSEALWINDTPLTAEQRTAVNEIGGEQGVGFAFVSVVGERTTDAAVENERGVAGWNVYHTARGDVGFPWNVVKLAALGGALVLVLGVVSIGLGLAAVESRDERSVLHVVGAPPAVLRRVAAAKALVLTASAALVAVPIGFVVVWVIRAASKDEFGSHAGVPWLAVVSLTVVVPVLATIATWIGSGFAQRFRPITASRMRQD